MVSPLSRPISWLICVFSSTLEAAERLTRFFFSSFPLGFELSRHFERHWLRLRHSGWIASTRSPQNSGSRRYSRDPEYPAQHPAPHFTKHMAGMHGAEVQKIPLSPDSAESESLQKLCGHIGFREYRHLVCNRPAYVFVLQGLPERRGARPHPARSGPLPCPRFVRDR